MTSIRTILDNLLKLFVDDGSFALAVILWVVLTGLLLPRISMAGALRGVVLFAGFAALLAGSLVRRTCQKPKRSSPGI